MCMCCGHYGFSLFIIKGWTEHDGGRDNQLQIEDKGFDAPRAAPPSGVALSKRLVHRAGSYVSESELAITVRFFAFR